MVATGVACSNKDDAPHNQASVPAGTVIEVAGTVTVAAKPLATGDSIAADDVVETGSDGSVAIVLAHNHVRWELGPGKRVKATDSLAWSQPVTDGVAKPIDDQDSAAAGRQAERAAAQGATTVLPAAAGDVGKGAAPAVVQEPAPVPARAAAPPSKPQAAQNTPTPEPTRGPVDRTLPSLNAAGADEATELSKCLALGQAVSIVIHVKAGAGTVTFAGTVDAKVKSCITTAVTGHTWPDATGDVKLQITR